MYMYNIKKYIKYKNKYMNKIGGLTREEKKKYLENKIKKMNETLGDTNKENIVNFPFESDMTGIKNEDILKEHYVIIEKLQKFNIEITDKERDKFNPDLVIENYYGYNIVRDDYLVGGTKQRGLIYFTKNLDKSKSLIYAGPPQGVAQVALSYIGQYIGARTYMLYAAPSEKPFHKMSLKAQKYGITLIWGGDNLSVVQKMGIEFAKKINGILLPFGLDNVDFKVCLIHALLQLKTVQELRKKCPKRLWLVAGSGVILHCLYHVFPTTYFMAVQVGKAVWNDTVDMNRTSVFTSLLKFQQSAVLMPPYPSVTSYDAKLWEFVHKYGKPGDYVWNVANEEI